MPKNTASGSPAVPGDVLGFMQVLWELTHALKSYSKRMHSTLGVTGPQRLLLRMLAEEGGVASPGLLAKTLRVHPSSLTGVLRRLEQGKLIRRSVHPVDRRRAVIALTARGKALSAQRNGTVEAAVRQILRELSSAEIQLIRDALGSLAVKLASSIAR